MKHIILKIIALILVVLVILVFVQYLIILNKTNKNNNLPSTTRNDVEKKNIIHTPVENNKIENYSNNLELKIYNK